MAKKTKWCDQCYTDMTKKEHKAQNGVCEACTAFLSKIRPVFAFVGAAK